MPYKTQKNPPNMTKHIQGTCLSMCPSSECILRQRERNLLHILECRFDANGVRKHHADSRRMVKEFSRCAAGNTIKASDVRPLPILQKTMKYLLSDVCALDHVSWREKYDFIANRIRAIQQDVVVQGLSGEPVALLLIPAVKFLTFAHYRLCECNISEFNAHLNMTQLNQNLMTIINIWRDLSYEIKNITYNFNKKTRIYEAAPTEPDIRFDWSLEPQDDSTDSHESVDEESDMQELEKKLTKVVLSSSNVQIERYSLIEEIEALYLLVNVHDPRVISHCLELPATVRNGQLFDSILKACLEYRNGNYYPLLSLAPSLPPILCCALHVNLPTIQRFALEVLSAAHSNPVLVYNADELHTNLLFNSTDELVKTCLNYGIAASSSGIKFSKSTFQKDAKVMEPSKIAWLEDKLNDNVLSTLFLL